jgi:hypothetical protein
MNIKRSGLALSVAAVVLAASGCQSGGHAGKGRDRARTTTSAAPVDAGHAPAGVTSSPTAGATVAVVLLSKKWVPRLDAVMDELKVCAPGSGPACSAAVASAYQAAKGFESDVLTTGTQGVYVHAASEAAKVSGAGAYYDFHRCGSKTSASADVLCEQQLLQVISGIVTLKAQMTRDERDARNPSAAADPSTPGATMPLAPVGAARTAYVNGLAAINIWLTHDPDRAVDNGRRQCQALDNGGTTDQLAHQAAQRFGSDGADLTDADGNSINQYLRQVLCPAT